MDGFVFCFLLHFFIFYFLFFKWHLGPQVFDVSDAVNNDQVGFSLLGNVAASPSAITAAAPSLAAQPCT